MPLGRALLLGAETVLDVLPVELAGLDRRDGADLGVAASKLTLAVKNGVNVQARCGRALARDLTKSQDQLLLEVVGEVILGTEENDTPLRDFKRISY